MAILASLVIPLYAIFGVVGSIATNRTYMALLFAAVATNWMCNAADLRIDSADVKVRVQLRLIAISAGRQLVLGIGLVGVFILAAVGLTLLHVPNSEGPNGSGLLRAVVAVAIGVAVGVSLSMLERRAWPLNPSGSRLLV